MRSMHKFLVFGLMIIFVAGCAGMQAAPKDPFAYGSYGTLATTAGAYKIIKDVFTDLRAARQVSDEVWGEFDRLANKFVDEHEKASKAMAQYKRGEIPQGAAGLAQAGLQMVLDELKDYYLAEIPKEKQKPL
jgi:hypothetical protein